MRAHPSLLVPFVLATLVIAAARHGRGDEAAARAEAEAGSRAWAAGELQQAADAFGRAVALDPTRPSYSVLRARALGELLAENDLSTPNLARLATIVGIWDELLANDPGNEEYAQAVPRLFERVGDEAGRERWLAARAANPAIAPAVRAAALRSAAESLLARASREAAAGRRVEAGRLAGRARTRLDAALRLDADSVASHVLRLHALELELESARQAGDSPRRSRLERLLVRARQSVSRAVERDPELPSPDDA